MNDIRYHIELFNGDLTKVVFEDGYSPNQPGRSAIEALQELREYRATRASHDLSVLRHRYTDKYNQPEAESEPEVTPKPAKRKKVTP